MKRLLVADDEMAIRLGIKEYAEFEGYKFVKPAMEVRLCNYALRKILI